MTGLSGFLDKRLASLAVIVVVVLAALVLVLDTLGRWRHETAALAELERHIEVLEARAAAVSTLDGGSGSDAAVDGRVLIFGDTPGLVAAEFQRVLTFIAESNGAVVRTIDTPESQIVEGVADTGGNALQKVRLGIEIEVMEQALPDLLHAIETDFPLMIVDGLSLRTNRHIGAAGDIWASSQDRPLALRLAVSGFRTERAH